MSPTAFCLHHLASLDLISVYKLRAEASAGCLRLRRLDLDSELGVESHMITQLDVLELERKLVTFLLLSSLQSLQPCLFGWVTLAQVSVTKTHEEEGAGKSLGQTGWIVVTCSQLLTNEKGEARRRVILT
ncbi:uncharacterized protein LACBIDRAFT_334410 [Laccaria bicolor S238N-H82]|uniref:Predicted protein n=1 Tax=Laccaria bicolor (strain S238N-H82 / ATCC MYA-4686) TaxID=486041 RepID=B0DZ46_LACBS|nr:uncharacterized protein LACBIDRAFT_334410 [Laccaria bicolor S238N-H82]EDR00127.1 predicted protein [Laccaria bicolor S238N-H82]|eukprot:XP_001889184.1 predicted protein [Laccaria bicolor S238N-H82]